MPITIIAIKQRIAKGIKEMKKTLTWDDGPNARRKVLIGLFLIIIR